MAPPSGKRLKRGDMVTTELTPCVDGYYAQICRTLVVGEANADQKAAHTLWREAMEAGIATVRPGITAADIAAAEARLEAQNANVTAISGDTSTCDRARVQIHASPTGRTAADATAISNGACPTCTSRPSRTARSNVAHAANTSAVDTC